MITKGQKINDRYEIIRSIGEGGMANVYLAHDIILDRAVAIKVLRGDLSNDDKFVRRFQREALSASSLSHPNIVEVYDVGEDDGKYYIVMEYINGKTLKELVKKRGALTLAEVVDIMSQLADGISVAHDAYIIHRDIKPQNVMILENGLVKITDFGIALALNSTSLTQTNSVMGSVHYIPPEQANGKGCTIKSDIYSLGILMYELVTGKVPFKGENAVEIALKHMKDPIPSVRKMNSAIPQSVENIILKACAKNPKNRYNSAKEMYMDLKTCLSEERANEPRVVYEFEEHDLDDTKVMKLVKEEPNMTRKKEDVVAQPITKQEMKSDKKLVLILSSILLSLILLCMFIFIVLPRLNQIPDVEIPNVAGKTIIEAEKILKEKGFEVNAETIEVSSENVDVGLVVKSDPTIGRTVKKGTKITLYISKGVNLITIEDYKGQNINEIKGKLIALKLNVLTEDKEVKNPKDYEEDEIVDQSVAMGEKLSPGDTIILYRAKVEVYPDMVEEGWMRQDAVNFKEKYGINLVILEEETDLYQEGTIIKQDRKAGTYIVPGATLTITVTVPVPAVEDPGTEEPGIGVPSE